VDCSQFVNVGPLWERQNAGAKGFAQNASARLEILFYPPVDPVERLLQVLQ
jgi:hypothetical protein